MDRQELQKRLEATRTYQVRVQELSIEYRELQTEKDGLFARSNEIQEELKQPESSPSELLAQLRAIVERLHDLNKKEGDIQSELDWLSHRLDQA